MKYILFNGNIRLNPADLHDVVVPMAIPFSEDNLVYAQKYSVDGLIKTEEIVTTGDEPTRLDAIDAQSTYTAMMTDTLLEE